MAAGTLIDPSLPYLKLFGSVVMPLQEFQKKLEAVVSVGDASLESGLEVAIADSGSAGAKATARPEQEIRMKNLGEALRGLFGKLEYTFLFLNC